MGWIWAGVLNGGLWGTGYLTARFGFRQPAGLPRIFAASVLAWAWLTVGMEILGASGWLGRTELLGWVAAGLLIGLACWFIGRKESEPKTVETEPLGWVEVAAWGLVIWVSVFVVGPSLVRAVKVVSDGPIYHLYFAARWWKAGRVELIATPFGESAAPYFPAVGDLWLTWLMVGFGGDLLAKIGQTPFLILTALAANAIARRLGAGRASSAVATAWFVTSSPVLLYAFEPIVDLIFVAGFLLATYFFLRHALGDDGIPALALGALAAGCALGTKAPAVVFVPPILALGATSAAWRGKGLWGKSAGVLLVLALPLTVVGFFYVRNAALTGNPLYPLHVSAFGRVWLAGWYGPDAMRSSQYYIDVREWRAFVDIMLGVIDPRLAPVWVAALAGLWAIGVKGRPGLDRWVWLISALAVMNVTLYWLVIPYRTQQRFMFHALGLAAVPLARLFDRGRWLRAAGVGLLAVHLLTPQNWPFSTGEPPWDLFPKVQNTIPGLLDLPADPALIRAVLASPGAFTKVLLTLALAPPAFLTAWLWGRGLRIRAGLTAAALIAFELALVYPWNLDERRRYIPPFPDYYQGWTALELRSGSAGSRVAYAGNDLPYYLMGSGLRNEVRYVNIDAHPGWLMHDYHKATLATGSGPPVWPGPRPGWDRAHPDYAAWLANLRAEGIQLLVVTRANPVEGEHNLADAEGFPIERVWADAHPDVFEILHGDRLFRLYRIVPVQPSPEKS